MKNFFLSILTLVIVILSIFCSYQHSEISTTKNNNIEYSDINLFDNIYFENQDFAFFSSNTIDDYIDENYNYYNVYWMLSINDLFKSTIDKDLATIMRNHIVSGEIAEESSYKYGFIYDIYLRVGIENLLGIKTNSEIYQEQLYSCYNSEDSFFYEPGYDSFEEGVLSTNLALQIMLSEESIINKEIINDIYINHKNFLEDKRLFNENKVDLKRDLISREMVILHTIIMCEQLLQLEKSINIQNIESWYKKTLELYNEYMFENKSINSFVYNGRNYLNNLQEYFDFNVEIKEVSFDHVELQQMITNNFTVDPQVTYEYIDTYIKQGHSISKHIYEYVNSTYELLIYDSFPTHNLKDMYFGIKISLLVNEQIDNDKIINFINEQYLNDFHNLNIEEIYYIEEIYQLLEVDNGLSENRKDITKAINDFLTKNDTSNIESLFYAAHISNAQNLLSIEVKESISKQLPKSISALNYNSDIYYYHKLYKLLGDKIDSTHLLNELDEYKTKNGYVMNKNNKIIDIFSNYAAFEIINEYEQLTPELIAYFQRVLEDFKINTGGYFIFLSDNIELLDYEVNFSLESMYYGLSLDYFLNKNFS